MKVLVCGGRDFTDEVMGFAALDAAHTKRPITLVISGGAKGGDAIGEAWAMRNNVHVARVSAIWLPYGSADRDRGAGPKRNAAMLLLSPDGVIAFPGGAGTADMARRAKAAGVKVWDLQR